MSIKKLFESADKSRNYLAETNEKNAFKDVESSKNVEQISIRQNTFVPNIDYRYPENLSSTISTLELMDMLILILVHTLILRAVPMA